MFTADFTASYAKTSAAGRRRLHSAGTGSDHVLPVVILQPGLCITLPVGDRSENPTR
jgi:hypothetical protein